MPFRSRAIHPRPRAAGALAIFTALTLAVTLLTPTAAEAAPKRDAFPKPPTSSPVDGSSAGSLDAPKSKDGDKSKVVKELPTGKVTVPLDGAGEPAAVGDTGITVRDVPADAEDSKGAVSEETDGADRTAQNLTVEVLGAEERKALGGADVALTLTPDETADGRVEVSIPDAVLDGAFGAGYASRVRWAAAPAGRSKDGATNADSVSVTRGAGATMLSVPTAEPTTLMAVSATTSTDGTGTFSATSLAPSSSWDVSAQTGAFAWSYPIPLPPAPAGLSPTVSLDYNSQLVDGATAATNNQPSAIGEGWTLSGSGFIERRYVPCSQEQAPGAPVAGSADMCWATDNATISFGGRSGLLVRDATTGVWRLQNDDNSRVEKLVGTTQGCADNGTYNTECWRLTTTDGTQYYFGLNKLPGWASGNETTNSAWTMPVFGNDAGDPCHAATFAASSCQQGWRWNLDYVVDVHGNAEAFYYQAETNKYRLNNTTPASYVRGGQLARIDYGLRSGTVYTAGAATSRVIFGYDAKGRCNPANQAACSSVTLGGDTATPTTPSVYPDVPFDLNCVSGDCAGQTSPSFWTTARLATITTQTRTGGQYKTADVYTLTHSFPDPGDGQDAALWLESVARTATAGTTSINEAATIFAKTPLQNRVWVVDGLAPLDKFRISSVTLPTGARISVNYSNPDCDANMAPTILASPWANDRRCFPQWWTPDLTIVVPPKQDLFHKYVVTSTIEDPYTGGGGSKPVRTEYVYAGTPAWRYVDDRLIPADRRTWSDYAGYDKVEIRVGDPIAPALQMTTQYLFYRGLNGDRANASGGTKSVTVTGTAVPDDRWFGGLTRSVKQLKGVGGAVISDTTTTPWASNATSDNGLVRSRVVGVSREDVTVPVSTGGTRTTSTINTMDARGFVTQTSAEAGAGQRATCTTTAYAADNASAWVIGLPALVTQYAVPCSQLASAVVPTDVLSHKKIAYDGAAVSAAATKGLPTSAWEAKGFTGATLATAQWVRTNLFAYDAMGRVASSTDAADRTVSTAYSPAADTAVGSGPLQSTTVTNPLGWTSTTIVDPFRGQQMSVVDENNKTTTMEYDALGRLTKGWATDRPQASNANSPSVKFEYGVFTDKPSYVKTTSLTPNGTMDTFALFDGLGRQIQSQAPVVGGGSVISDTEYDSAGREWAANKSYFAPAVTPGTALFVPSALSQIESRTETVFDGAGRATAQVIRSFGAEIRRTSTTYRGDDRVDVAPPAGGIPTSTFTDAWGQTTKKSEWMGAIDGAGVESVSLQYQYNGRGQMTQMTDDDGNAWTWTFDQRGRQTATTDPDAGPKSFTYDELGQTLTTTDARNVTLGYTYDGMGRRTTERSGGVSGTILASWAYDSLAKGQLTSSSRFVDGLEYKTQVTGYDNAYRPTGSKVVIPAGAPAFAGTTYATSTYYNGDGSVAADVRPAIAGLPKEELYPSYDVLGRQSGLSGAVGYASGVVYTAAGELGQIVRPGTTWSALTFGYEAGTRQLASLEETTRRGTVFTREALREYSRNAASIITRASTKADTHITDVQCFSYDGLQALTEAWTPPSGDCVAGPTATLGGPASYRVAFTVDPDTGNRTSATTWAGGTSTLSSYTYPAAGQERPHAVSQVTRSNGTGQPQVASYGYDAAGATTGRDGQTLTYDDAGRLATVTAGAATEKSLYTADGSLLMRWGGADGASLFMGDTVLRSKAGVTTGVRSYTVAGITVAERTSGTGSGLWWLSPDPVGTVGLQINVASGQVTRRWMDPFGEARGTASGAWSSLFGYLNAPASSTGLTQLGARTYDAALGKFVSVDPLLDTAEPRHANAYTYSYHSPISYSDPTGLISNRMMIDDGRYAKKPTAKTGTINPPAPPAAGNKPTASVYASGGGGWSSSTSYAASCGYSSGTCGGGVGGATQRASHPMTADQWAGLGLAVLGVALGVAGVACILATAGVCAAPIAGGGLALAGGGTVAAGSSIAAGAVVGGTAVASGAAATAYGTGMLLNESVGTPGAGAEPGARSAGGDAASGANLSAPQQRAVNSLQRQLQYHQNKLEAYRANPEAYDNLGLLERAPTAEIRQQIIDGRIRHLETEIRTFRTQIDELLGGG